MKFGSFFLKIFSGTLVVSAGIIVGSFFSYLLQFFLGRYLSVADFGTFNAILSLAYLIGFPSAVLTTSIIKIVSELYAKKDFVSLKKLFWWFSKAFTVLGFVIFVFLSLTSFYIGKYLNIKETYLLIYFAFSVWVSYINISPGAYLQGLLRYKAYAFFAGMLGFLRFLGPAVFVLLGFGLRGVFGGMALGGITLFVCGYFILQKNLNASGDSDIKSFYSKVLKFSLPVLFVNSGMSLLNNIDMLMVKKYFSPDSVGYYAGTVTLGKILLFGVGTVATIMYPQISQLYTLKKDYIKRFWVFFRFQVIMVFFGVSVFVLFPQALTTLFFKNRFLASVEYLPRFSIFIGLYVMINFIVLFFLAIEKTLVSIILLPAAFFQFILLNVYNQNLLNIINVNIGICVFVLLSLVLLLNKTFKESAHYNYEKYGS